MRVLTEQEVAACQYGEITPQLCEDMLPFAEAIEAAVIKRLAAGVSVEPDGWRTQEYIGAPSQQEPYYNADTFTTAIAAARVQAIEECAKVCETELCDCCWDDDAKAAAEHLAEQIRNLK